MRGRKIDTEFVTDYINKCVTEGVDSIEDIINRSQEEINFIDSKIKEVENLKKLRCKLIDIKLFLNKSTTLT